MTEVKDEIEERDLRFRDAIEDLLVRRLAFQEEPVSTKHLELSLPLSRETIEEKLKECKDVTMTDDGKWEVDANVAR